MDDDFAVIDVVDREDLQHAPYAVGSDVQHANDLIDVRLNGSGCHRDVDRVVGVRVSDPVAASAGPDLLDKSVSQ
jgi:hypothetical protein